MLKEEEEEQVRERVVTLDVLRALQVVFVRRIGGRKGGGSMGRASRQYPEP